MRRLDYVTRITSFKRTAKLVPFRGRTFEHGAAPFPCNAHKRLQISKLTRYQMNLCLTVLAKPPQLFGLWLHLVPSTYPMIFRSPLIYKTAALCGEVHQRLVYSSSSMHADDNDFINDSLMKLKTLNTEIEDFKHMHFAPLLEDPIHDLVTCPDWLAGLMSVEGAPTRSYVFSKFYDANGWLLFTAAQMRVRQAILSCVHYAEIQMLDSAAYIANTRAASEEAMARLFDDVRAAVTPNLGMSKDHAGNMATGRAISLLWPCSIALATMNSVLERESNAKAACDWMERLLCHVSGDIGFQGSARLLDMCVEGPINGKVEGRLRRAL